MNDMIPSNTVLERLTKGEEQRESEILNLVPDVNQEHLAEMIKQERATQLESMIKTGMLLIKGKRITPHGHFTAWIKELGITPKTGRDYMQYARIGYRYLNEIKELSGNKFRLLVQLDEEVLEKSLESGLLNGKPLKELTNRDIEDLLEKANAREKLLENKLSTVKTERENAIEEIKEGKEQVSSLEKKIFEKEKEIERLKNPKKLAEEHVRLAQGYVNEANIALMKAKNLEIPYDTALPLLKSHSVTMDNLVREWSPQWEDSHK